MQSNVVRSGSSGIFQSIVSVLFMICLFTGLYFVAYYVLKALYWVTPVLIPVIAILNLSTLKGYFTWSGTMVKRQFWSGIVAIALSLLFYPFVLIGLLIKAIVFRKVQKIEEEYLAQDRKQNYTPFVEVESRRKDTPVPSGEKRGFDYDNLFE